MKKIFLFLLVFNIFQCFSQNKMESIVYIENIECDNCIKDTIILYSDSTFRANSYIWWQHIQTSTSGTYSIADSIIFLNSFLEHKRLFKVNEEVCIGSKRVYEWDYDSTLVYYGRRGFIIEFDKDYNQFLDTLFFFPTKEFRLESNQKNSIGFVIYVSYEYTGEYFFTDLNSNKITIWFSDHLYIKERSSFYLRNCKFGIIDNYSIKQFGSNLELIKQ